MALDDTQDGPDLKSIVNDALDQNEAGNGQNPPSYLQDGGQGELLERTPSGQNGKQPNQQEKLLAGKYKTAQDLEKAYMGRDKQANQAMSKLQKLEALLENPRFQEQAASDPQMREALAKLGYEVRQEDQQQASAGEEPWDGNESDPRFQMAVLEEKQNLRWNLFEFAQERGKRLNTNEEKAIREVLQLSPRFMERGIEGIKMAWKLTPFYDQEVKAKEDERMSKLQARPGVKRPSPNPMGPTGQKLDLKKPVTEMNDAERRAYLNDLVDKNS